VSTQDGHDDEPIPPQHVAVEATESDYFEALSRIRTELERHGHVVNCYGASRTVFPSGMARDMGAGLKAYKLRIGEPALVSDLVSIFACGPDLEVTTVAEQRAFYQQWLASLRTRR
jgi:hypothetical protein